MKITIFYKKKNRVDIRMVENVLVPWDVIADYKIRYPLRSEEVVMEVIAKVFLKTLRGDVEYMGWQEVK